MAQETKTVKLADVVDSGRHFIFFLKKRILFIVLLVLLCMGAAFIYYLFQKPDYQATATFIMEEKSGSTAGLAGLASQFGLDIGGASGNSGLFSGDNILDILKSRSMVEKVLLSRVDSSKGLNSESLADLYLGFSGLRSKWKEKNALLANVSLNPVSPNHSLLQDSVLYVIYERLYKNSLVTDRLNKKGSIIKVTTSSANPVFSKCMTERLLSEASTLYIGLKTGVSAANVARLEKRADSLLRVLNAKSYQGASLQVLDPNTAFKTTLVPVETTQRDKMVASALYTEVMKNLEASRMALAQQTPVIQILDAPKYPLIDERKTLGLLLLSGLLAGIIISLVICFFTYPSKTNI
ncbi:MAG: hypothetical protein JWN76_947 [Chitinophagaceae bacterium]|nr:hypothetical protein [Chitinophagaceae bacterium]